MEPRSSLSGSASLSCLIWTLCLLCFSTAGQADEKEEQVRFVINKIVIQGNTILSPQEMDGFKEAFEGRTATLADVQQWARVLESRYRSRGYATTRVLIPPQDVSDRVLILRVREGRIGAISVEGCKYFSFAHNYSPYLPRKGSLLNTKELERSLGALNSHPDKQGRIELLKGKVEGTTDLLLKLKEQRPLHLSLGLDNTGTQGTPRHRAVATVQYDNFFDRSQVGVFQFTTSPGKVDMVRQYAGTYFVPLGPLGGPIGHSFTVYGAYSESKTETILDLLQLEGKGTVMGAQYAFPLPEVMSFKQRLSLGLEWQKVEDVTGFVGATITDEVHKLPLVAWWSATRRDAKAVTGLSARLRYQKDGLLRHFDQEDYEAMRGGTEVDFWNAVIGVERLQALSAGWSCSLACEAQLSGDRLLPSEQYGLGGYSTVRGYRNRAITADEGLNIRAELRAPSLPQLLPGGVNESIRPLLFLDAGRAWNHDPGPGELDQENMAGVGVGLRASFFDAALTARVDVGRALKDLDATARNEKGDMVVHFGIQYRF